VEAVDGPAAEAVSPVMEAAEGQWVRAVVREVVQDVELRAAGALGEDQETTSEANGIPGPWSSRSSNSTIDATSYRFQVDQIYVRTMPGYRGVEVVEVELLIALSDR